MARYQESKYYFEQALILMNSASDSSRLYGGHLAGNFGELYRVLNQHDKALPLLYQAARISAGASDLEELWRAQGRISNSLAVQGDPTSAIFWGKQAVNTIQSLRGDLIKLDREMQTSFLNDKRWVYTELSQQLIAAGRIPEAQRVMALLKEEELFDFVRRDADSAPASSELPLTGVERRAAEQYKVLGDRLATLAQEELRLQEIRRKGGATEADLARLAELEAPLAEARDAFMAFTTGLRQVLAGQAEHREKAALVDRQIESHQNLLADLGAAGQGVAALQYVASREKLSIIVSTQAIQLAREVPIAEKDLNQHIAELRSLLQDPKLDPRAAAQRLHALLIEPILADLQAQNVHTLMLLQDGALRYLPFAALHDGRRYLVENYQLAIYTAAAQSSLVKSPAAQWQVAALGVTRAFPEQNFRALDAVQQELNGIVHPQVLPGQVYLDEQFNRTALLNNLGRPVLHVASHFRFIEGSDQSFLLLGDGSRLSLADLRRMPRFNGVDLLTLSACDTATGGGLREDGREVEGLGAEVQKKGARAVLATLWPVADRSTGELMRRFYRAREGGHRNKAQALRQAQLALLGAASGDTSSAGLNEPRGAKPATAPGAGDGKPAPFVAPARAPYAHPYYWAPFILMGN
jgi:CHAT domain-containing protein